MSQILSFIGGHPVLSVILALIAHDGFARVLNLAATIRARKDTEK